MNGSAMRPLAAAKGLSLRTSVQRSIIVNGDAAFLPNVFGRGSQATAGRFGGLIHGLAIVKHIVELRRLRRSGKRGQGKGTTFTIRIPCPE